MNLDDLEFELRKLDGVQSAGFNERDDVLLVQVHTTSTPVEPDLALHALCIAYRHSEQPVAVEVVRWRSHDATSPGSDREAPEETVSAAGSPNGAVIDLVEPVATENVDVPAETSAGAEPTDAQRPGARDESLEKRVRLLAVLTFPDTDEIEVHLTLDGRRSIGRGTTAHEAAGAVEATLDALHRFTPTLEYRLGWARPVEGESDADRLICAVELDSGGASPALYGLSYGAGVFEAAARATLQALNRTLALELRAAS